MEKHSEIHENDTNNLWSFFRGLLVGGLAGSVTMLLVAPQSGRRTRAKIQERSNELRDQASDMIEEKLAQTRYQAHQIKKIVKKQSEAIQQRGQDLVDDQKERLSSLAESGKSAAQGVLSSRMPGK